METSRIKLTGLVGLALFLLASLIVLVFGHIRSLEQSLSEVNEANRVLERRAENAETALDASRATIVNIEAQLTEIQQPQPVNGPANFPISRVLAQRGDTVAALARRQNTSPEVIYALNPWLDGADDLIVGQAIWIPNGEE